MPRKLPIALLVIVAVGWLCLRLVRKETDAPLERPSAAAAPIPQDEKARSARLDAADGLPSRAASSRILPPSSTDPTSDAAPFASFVYSNGTPAAGLSVSSASAPSVYDIEVAQGPANWKEHLDDQGRMAEDVARRLGDRIVVRLSSCSLQLMHLEPSAGQRYVLPEVVVQAFRLSPSVPGVSAQFRIENNFTGIGSSIEFEKELTGADFADRFRVTAGHPLRGAHVLVCARGELGPEAPSLSISLPAGSYSITPIGCSFGWWFDYSHVEVSEASIDIRLHQVPVTTVMLPTERDGLLRKPTDARVLVAAHMPDGSGGSGEIALPWKVERDRLLVSQVYRVPGDENGYTYALKIYWSDGTDSTAQAGNWESLLGTVTFDK